MSYQPRVGFAGLFAGLGAFTGSARSTTAGIVVFAVFVLAMLVLAVLVTRFAIRQHRQALRVRRGSDDPAAPALDDDADHR
ncbi:MAG TPA: hypothetical protein VGS21_08055 [Acidimicrobiales bacterium]|nr:hypothetical protein [Acidimicrobiales bacterium]